jgi:acid phosphatase type 7
MAAMAVAPPHLPVPVPPHGPVAPPDPVLAAAGDIACDTATPQFNATYGAGDVCQMRSTSDLLLAIHPAAVATLGDNQYENASLREFDASFDPTWGRLKPEIHPAIGNHEIETDPKASGYYQYFGAAAGDPTKGYYSYDLGTWHVVVLNSNCVAVGGCGPGSPEEQWLRADLATHPDLCTLAYWHHPRWTSGEHGNNPLYDTFWRDLYGAGVDVVLNGHDHDYERFAPQDPSGRLDKARGIREFVSGTGGSHFESLAIRQPNSEALSQTFGVLALTLHPSGYDWRFVPEPGKTFTDSGTAACH